jgi:hypothetical protein
MQCGVDDRIDEGDSRLFAKGTYLLQWKKIKIFQNRQVTREEEIKRYFSMVTLLLLHLVSIIRSVPNFLYSKGHKLGISAAVENTKQQQV